MLHILKTPKKCNICNIFEILAPTERVEYDLWKIVQETLILLIYGKSETMQGDQKGNCKSELAASLRSAAICHI
ncbi:MAG: hypothetical protein HYX20_00725 [Candidatus Yanofskybacteria bacterium]|nr:hypothetical protein [Candidatus Yanofskybacteria bacterium]